MCVYEALGRQAHGTGRDRDGRRIDVELTAQQREQLTEIFELFDTDGGGTVDRHELDAAMFALGFQTDAAPGRGGEGEGGARGGTGLDMRLVDTDGSQSITLEEFTSLMKGELISSDPLEGVWAAFATLSRPDGGGWGGSTANLAQVAGHGSCHHACYTSLVVSLFYEFNRCFFFF
jgi:hypothetical protein